MWRKAIGWVVMISAALGQEEPADVFGILGKTPEEVAGLLVGASPAGMLYDPYALAVLPLTENRKRELVRHLLAAEDGERGRTVAAGLREAWGESERALEILGDAEAPEERFHQVRVLYLVGRTQEAAAVFRELLDGDGLKADSKRLYQTCRPLMAMGKLEGLDGFLGFLMRQEGLPLPWVRSLLGARREVAAHYGRTPELIEALDRDLPWLAGHGRALVRADEELPELGADPDLRLLVLRTEMRGLDATTWQSLLEALRSRRGAAEDRRAVFLAALLFAGREGWQEELVAAVLNDEEELLSWLPEISPRTAGFDDPVLAKALLALAVSHPENHALQIVAARAVPGFPGYSAGPAGFPQESVDRLMAGSKAPLRAQPADGPGMMVTPNLNVTPLLFGDPAAAAISLLSFQLEPEELKKLVVEREDFRALDRFSQARYLALAGLDEMFLDAMLELDWRDPAHDQAARALHSYLRWVAQKRFPDRKTLAAVQVALVPIVCGSEEKPAALVAADLMGMASALEQDPEWAAVERRRFLERCVERLAERPDEDRELIAARCQQSFEGWGAEDLLAGLEVAREPAMRSDRSGDLETLALLGFFAPPDVPGFPQPYGAYGGDSRGRHGFHGPEWRAIFQLGSHTTVAARFIEFLGGARRDAGRAERLRRLLPEDHEAALTADLLVALKALHTDDEKWAKAAEKRLEEILAAPEGWEQVLFCVALETGRGKPDALERLEMLLEESWEVRSKAVELLRNPYGQRRPEAGQQWIRRLSVRPNQPVSPEKELALDVPEPQLQRLLQEEKTPSPETLELAEKVLDAFVEAGRRNTTPEENLALQALARVGGIAGYLEKVRREFKEQGRPELDLHRALHSLHLYRLLHKEGESLVWAERILRAAPDDIPAARDIVEMAIAGREVPLFFEAVSALVAGKDRLLPQVMANQKLRDTLFRQGREFLGVLSKHPEPTVLAAELVSAHAALVRPDPELAATIRDHFLGWGFFHHAHFGVPANVGPNVAESLVKAGRVNEAVEFLAAVVNPLPEAMIPRQPGQFPAAWQVPVLRGNALPQHASAALQSALKLDLAEQLRRALMPEMEDSTAVRVFVNTLRFFEKPDMDRYGRCIEALGDSISENVRNGFDRALLAIGDTLVQRLAVRAVIVGGAELPAEDEPLNPGQILTRLGLINETADAEGFRALAPTLARLLDEKESHVNPHTVGVLIESYARFGNDEEWEQLAELARPHLADQSTNLMFFHQLLRACEGKAGPSRVRSVLPEVLERVLETNVHRNGSHIDHCISVAWRAGDEESLNRLAANVPDLQQDENRVSLLLRLIGLLVRHPDAMNPALSVEPQEGGGWRVRWSLLGLPSQTQGGAQVLGIDSSFLDGSCELHLLAGPDAHSLTRVRRMDAAPARGELVVGFPPETSHVALLAIHPTSGAIRLSTVLELATEQAPGWEQPEFAFPDEMRFVGKLPEQPLGGGEPVLSLTMDAHGQTVDLAEIPWQPGQKVNLSGWMSGGQNLQLMLIPVDADGTELQRVSMRGRYAYHYTASQPPVWFPMSFNSETLPPTTERLFLRAALHGAGSGEMGHMHLAHLRLLLSGGAEQMEGLEKLARTPGQPTQVMLDRTGERLALAYQDGAVAIFSLETRTVTTRVETELKSLRLVGFAGSHVALADGANGLHAIRFPEGIVRRLAAEEPDGRSGGMPHLLTDDGRWLLWTGRMGDINFISTEPGAGAKLRTIRVGAGPQLAYDHERAKIFVGGELGMARLESGNFEQAEIELGPAAPHGAAQEAQRLKQEELARFPFRIQGRPQAAEPAFAEGGALLVVPVSQSSHAVAPDGRVYYVDSYGIIYRLDPAKLERK